MSDTTPPNSGGVDPTNGAAPSPPPPSPPADEISIEDLDKLLEEEDPEFAKMLLEVRNVETDTSVVIESSVETEDSPEKPEPAVVVENLEGFDKYKELAKQKMVELRLKARMAIYKLLTSIWASMKTWPKRSALFLKATAILAKNKFLIPVKWTLSLTRIQKIALAGTTLLTVACVVLLIANFRGIWLPYMNEPILKSLAEVADHSYDYDLKDTAVFYSAFPQEIHEFLFDKFKVNLRRTEDHPNPMAAFEIVVAVDSKDTAIELSSRETELFDLTQRILEDETYEELESDLGKKRFKSRLKRELTSKLTQGWVKDISFRTMVLKP